MTKCIKEMEHDIKVLKDCIRIIAKEFMLNPYYVDQMQNISSQFIDNLYDKIVDEDVLSRDFNEIKNYLLRRYSFITDIIQEKYDLKQENMNLKEITDILVKGSNVKNKEITITFKEGKTMRSIAKTIDENTTNSYEEVFDVLSNKDYINSLINKYWFLDDVILNSNIYYPLEGYLAPDTYNFDVNADVKAIFEKMLDQTDKILTELKPSLEKSGLKVHEVLTLASMAESEGVSLEDRKNIVGVFMNRIKNNMALGSDVTTYYASKIELGERDLYMSEINSDNPYNTRSAKNAGKLPVGPICNPSKSAIEATINYTQNDYLYFVADKNMKVYFTKTDAEHNKKIQELKNQGLWFEY